MKILCIRLSAIGDVAVATPIVRALKRQLGAELHFLTRAVPAIILEANPYIDRLLLYGEVSTAQLRRERYTVIVDLHCNIRSLRLRLALGVPSVGYRKRNLEKHLLERGVDLLGEEHLVDRYFRAYAPLGIVNDGEGLDYFVRPNERYLAGRAVRSLGGAPYVALVLGATHYTKRMVAPVIRAVIDRSTAAVVLLGGADVRALADEVLAAPGPGGRVLDLVDALPLRISIAVLAEARRVITPDTGLMHVAAALRRPISLVWGNGARGYGMYPYLPTGAPRASEHAVPGLACRPCSRIGYAACPRGHFRCMRDQDAAEIAGSAAENGDRSGGERTGGPRFS